MCRLLWPHKPELARKDAEMLGLSLSHANAQKRLKDEKASAEAAEKAAAEKAAAQKAAEEKTAAEKAAAQDAEGQ